MKVFYRLVDVDQETYFEYTTLSHYDLDIDYECEALMEECADHYWREHDGWENSWPQVFSLHLEEGGPEILRSTIEMEAEPRFFASKITI